jgi:hypothetical protein
MNERDVEEMLNYLSRIATAVEVIARTGKPDFTPDHSRAKNLRKERATLRGEPKSGD